MRPLLIGKADGKNFSLPPDVVTSTLVVYGGKGMGKTNLGAVLVEELSRAGLRWVAADPLGVWWGLRHNREGKGPGIECLILGGVHGDIPIEPTGGAVVADLVVDYPESNVIIDFSRKPSGEMWGVAEKVRFLTHYAKRLFQRQGSLEDGRRREPLFQIVDEAARYVPQIIPAGNPDLAMCVAAWEQLVEEGRNIGIGVGLLTQRSARMNKSVSELADAMLAFRVLGPNSISAVTDWLGEHVPKDRIRLHMETLRSLDRGRCLLVSPGWLKFEGIVDIRARETFDSSATPKPGERPKKVSGKAAKPDLAKYAERMKETIERAKSEDPKALRQQVQELKNKLVAAEKQAGKGSAGAAGQGSAPPKAPDPKVIERAVQSAVKTATTPLLRQIETIRKQAKQAVENFAKAAGPLNAIANIEMPEIPRIEAVANLVESVDAGLRRMERGEPRPVIVRPPRPAAESNGSLSMALVKVLSRLEELLDCTHSDKVAKAQLAAWAEYSPNSGGYNNYLGTLRSQGLITYPSGGYVAITEEGRKHAQPGDVPVNSKQMLERAKLVLGGSEARLLELLHESREETAKTELAEASGFSPNSGGFNNYLGHMRTLGFIEYPKPGMVKCADWLYLNGDAA